MLPQEIGTAGQIMHIADDDPDYEMRTCRGWDSTANAPTGPTEVSRQDRPGSYTETLTMSATLHLTNGAPDGTAAISNLQTLARSYTNPSGQVVRSDAYFNLAGVAYTIDKYIGTQNTNYYTTLTDYDGRGRQNRTQRPTGTISRVVYDSLGRPLSSWVGTNDTGATDADPTGGHATGNNMIQVSANVYDGGGVGDGLLTQTTVSPGGGLADRVTQYYYYPGMNVAQESHDGIWLCLEGGRHHGCAAARRSSVIR